MTDAGRGKIVAWHMRYLLSIFAAGLKDRAGIYTERLVILRGAQSGILGGGPTMLFMKTLCGNLSRLPPRSEIINQERNIESMPPFLDTISSQSKTMSSPVQKTKLSPKGIPMTKSTHNAPLLLSLL
jgi:hypothetical protein